MARRPTNAAQRPRAPAESIDALSFGALRSLAENPEASPQTLALLSRDPLLDVRVAVAWNARTPATALARLADGPVELQAGVAQNPAASAEVLGRLATHADPVVRRGPGLGRLAAQFGLSFWSWGCFIFSRIISICWRAPCIIWLMDWPV